jgi:hypothetical protein
MIAVETRNSRSCAEPKAQAEAGPLIPMMRRANMGASIAGEGGNRKGRQGRLNVVRDLVADFSKDTNLLISGEKL